MLTHCQYLLKGCRGGIWNMKQNRISRGVMWDNWLCLTICHRLACSTKFDSQVLLQRLEAVDLYGLSQDLVVVNLPQTKCTIEHTRAANYVFAIKFGFNYLPNSVKMRDGAVPPWWILVIPLPVLITDFDHKVSFLSIQTHLEFNFTYILYAVR